MTSIFMILQSYLICCALQMRNLVCPTRARSPLHHFSGELAECISTVASTDGAISGIEPTDIVGEFCAPPGVGKSNLLSALGVALCKRGHRVYFTTAAALLMRLIAAKRSGSLARKYRTLDRIDVLLVNELGYIPFELEATDLLFQLVSQ